MTSKSPQAAGKIARTAHDLKIVDPHEPLVTNFSSPSAKALTDAGTVTAAYLKITQRIYTEILGNDPQAAADLCGFSPAAAEALLRFKPDIRSQVFARSDLIWAQGRWQLLELNVGSTIGGLFYASLPRLAGFPQSHDVLRTWANKVCATHSLGGSIAFVEDSVNVEYMRLSLPVMARELEQAARKPVAIEGHRDLSWDGRHLSGPNGVVSAIYCLFNELDVVKAPESYSPILKAIEAGAVELIMGPGYRLIANKGMLAVTHSLAESCELTPAEQQLVRDHIPTTRFVDVSDSLQLKNERTEWILKPIDGFAGLGIRCGVETSQSEWESLIDQIIGEGFPKSYVAQRFLQPEVKDIEITSADGTVGHQKSRLLWGSFVFGADYLGAFVRAKPDQGSNIINHANGACVGPVPEYW